jgi:endo-1,4-beta-xylanase
MRLPVLSIAAGMGLFICFPGIPKEIDTAKITHEAVEARIAKIRMGDLTIKTRPGADVTVRQTRHEFLFGTAICNSLVAEDSVAMSAENKKLYIKTLKENFNYAVHENALKWYDCEKKENAVDYASAEKIWEICRSLGIPMRGHCIFWEKDKYIMPWLRELDYDELHAAVVRRALDVTRRFKGRINEFDLDNELINGDFFRRRLGYGIVSEMAWLAKVGNPDAVLFVNDYGILTDNGFNARSYMEQIRKLIAMGVPVGGIGCQGHPGTEPVIPMSARHVQRWLDSLSQFGLPIKITEALFVADDENKKAREFQRIFPLYFAHPAVEAILVWGFWEGDMWKPEAAMWKRDWTPNPIAAAYRDLVFNKWWTNGAGKADKTGEFKMRAFYGDYEIVSGGVTKRVTLSKKDKTTQVTF